MERGTKLAGGYLRLSCVFLAFLCVSSDHFYTPNLYFKQLDHLLGMLKSDFIYMNLHGKLKVVEQINLENDRHCAGTFLGLFQNETEHISNLLLIGNGNKIIAAIRDCITKLKENCENIRKQDPTCNGFIQEEPFHHFIPKFVMLLKRLQQWKTCEKSFNQEDGFSKDYNREIPICGIL